MTGVRDAASRPGALAAGQQWSRAVFYESDEGLWHASMRSREVVDVGRVCTALGGGGHSRAAGFTAREPVPDTLARLRGLLGSIPWVLVDVGADPRRQRPAGHDPAGGGAR